MQDNQSSRTSAASARSGTNDQVDAWAELLRVARISIAEQDLNLRYTAAGEQTTPSPVGPHVIGRHESDVFSGDALAQLTRMKQRAIEEGSSLRARVCLPVNGEQRWFETTVTPRRDGTGRPSGVLSLSVDMSEIVGMTERLRASEARLAGILGAAMDAIVSVGTDHRIVYFNPAAEQMFGVAADDAIGSDIARFIPVESRGADRSLIATRVAGDLEGGRPALGKLRARRASGESFPIEASISTADDGDKLTTVIIRDRSEHDQLQAQLLQSQKLEGIGRLAGGVAHDFNNLLTVILGYCELLRVRQRRGVELDEIDNAARRASQLTRQLLAFSRRQVLQVETLDLNGLVRGLNRMLRRIIGEDVQLRTELTDDPTWVVADVGQMEQVLLNLVVNARDAMPGGGSLRVATQLVQQSHATAPTDAPPRTLVELTVQDTGVGMAEDVRSRIFEPFYTTKGDAGTGLGLSTVYGIVTQTGGEITCRSAPGAGATFIVRLPLGAAPPAEKAGGPTAPGAQRGSETVLLVEDDGLVRELAARALREYGYTVLEARDVDGALRYLDSPGLAVVVSDVVMPGRSGDDLATEVARRRPGLPVLLVTGYSESLLQQPVDAAHLLRKPFTPADLVARIRHLIDASRG